jgi:hypothetical protein
MNKKQKLEELMTGQGIMNRIREVVNEWESSETQVFYGDFFRPSDSFELKYLTKDSPDVTFQGIHFNTEKGMPSFFIGCDAFQGWMGRYMETVDSEGETGITVYLDFNADNYSYLEKHPMFGEDLETLIPFRDYLQKYLDELNSVINSRSKEI